MATHPYTAPKYDYKKQHEGTEKLSINNTFTRRFLTRLALCTTAKFHSPIGTCDPISRHKIVKTGPIVHLTEAATMQFLREHTSIPVPKVHSAFVHKGRAYIVMERIQGEPLIFGWKKLRKEELQAVLAQASSMIQELRALTPPPGTGVASCAGGSLFDSRMMREPWKSPRFGPFKTIQEFHAWLRKGFNAEDLKKAALRVSGQELQDAKDMLELQDGPWPPPIFTHGDLNPSNILVQGTKVVGIIDWEFAGWYPYYWEYTSAWLGNRLNPAWQDILDKMLDPPDPEVFKMEQTRHKWWGEI